MPFQGGKKELERLPRNTKKETPTAINVIWHLISPLFGCTLAFLCSFLTQFLFPFFFWIRLLQKLLNEHKRQYVNRWLKLPFKWMPIR